MDRKTGRYRISTIAGEEVRAFIPHPLPPTDPPLVIDGPLAELHADAVASVGRLQIAGAMVPDPGWFLYGFVRKEAVLSSQIEGTQATLQDIAAFEATSSAHRPEDVEEVCNYVEALNHVRTQIADERGLPISTRLLCDAHRILMKGVRGEEKQPGEVRRSQNWIGGTRPGNARFVPPPPDDVPRAMAALEKWLHSDDALPPLIKAGLAHVQFETIHPFLDGNGRIGRMLITLLVEHWRLLDQPLLYLSVAFRRQQQEYYERLSAVRADGDWEGWVAFFLHCVRETADDAVHVAGQLFNLVSLHRKELLGSGSVTLSTIRLHDLLPDHPVVTLPRVIELLGVAKPTAARTIDDLVTVGILRETTGKQRDRVYVYDDYLKVLTGENEQATSASDARDARFKEALERVHKHFGSALRRLAD